MDGVSGRSKLARKVLWAVFKGDVVIQWSCGFKVKDEASAVSVVRYMELIMTALAVNFL
jgi:hypothetical protein